MLAAIVVFALIFGFSAWRKKSAVSKLTAAGVEVYPMSGPVSAYITPTTIVSFVPEHPSSKSMTRIIEKSNILSIKVDDEASAHEKGCDARFMITYLHLGNHIENWFQFSTAKGETNGTRFLQLLRSDQAIPASVWDTAIPSRVD